MKQLENKVALPEHLPGSGKKQHCFLQEKARRLW